MSESLPSDEIFNKTFIKERVQDIVDVSFDFCKNIFGEDSDTITTAVIDTDRNIVSLALNYDGQRTVTELGFDKIIEEAPEAMAETIRFLAERLQEITT